MDIIEFLRSFKLIDYAIFDFIISFLFIYLASGKLSSLFKKIKIEIPKNNWLYLVLPLSILIHIIIGRYTPMTTDFLDINGHYGLKIIIFILIYLGLRNIKKIKPGSAPTKVQWK